MSSVSLLLSTSSRNVRFPSEMFQRFLPAVAAPRRGTERRRGGGRVFGGIPLPVYPDKVREIRWCTSTRRRTRREGGWRRTPTGRTRRYMKTHTGARCRTPCTLPAARGMGCSPPWRGPRCRRRGWPVGREGLCCRATGGQAGVAVVLSCACAQDTRRRRRNENI